MKKNEAVMHLRGILLLLHWFFKLCSEKTLECTVKPKEIIKHIKTKK